MSIVTIDLNTSNDETSVCQFTDELSEEINARALQWEFHYEMMFDKSSNDEDMVTHVLLPKLESAMLSELLGDVYGCSFESSSRKLVGVTGDNAGIVLHPNQNLRRYLTKYDDDDALLQLSAVSPSPSDNVDTMSFCRILKPEVDDGATLSCSVIRGIMTLHVTASASTAQEQDLKDSLYSQLRTSAKNGVFDNGIIHTNIQAVILQDDADPTVSDGADLEMQIRSGVGEWLWIGTLLAAVAMILVFGAIVGYKKHKHNQSRRKEPEVKIIDDVECQTKKQETAITNEEIDGSVEILHTPVSRDVCKSMFGSSPSFHGGITMLKIKDHKVSSAS